MANKKDDDRSVYLITEQIKQYTNTQDVVYDLYLNKLLIHPVQIQSITLTPLSDQNKQYLSIHLIMRSITERHLFIFKILNQKDQELRLNMKHHSNIVLKLQKQVMVINFASNARSLRLNEKHQTAITFRTLESCVISRWKGHGIIKTDSSLFISIEIPIEPYYELKMKPNKTERHYIPLLHTLQLPYVLKLKLFRENVFSTIPTTNDEIRAYQIHLKSIHQIDKIKTILNNNDDNKSTQICRWNDGYCPKQHKKQCPYHHKAWLEPGIDHGNNDIKWESSNEFKTVPAASVLNHEEFNVKSTQLMDVLKYSSVIRMEFISMDHRSYQLLDDRLNKILKGTVKDQVISVGIHTSYPNNISLKPSVCEYHSPYIYGKRSKDNIHSIQSFMNKWNDNDQHNTSFALSACISNWPNLFIPEDIDDTLLTLIDEDVNALPTLLIMAQNERFRDKYIMDRHDITASEIYLNARDYVENNNDKRHVYPLRYICVLPFHLELSIEYIVATQLFSNTKEGRSYTKLSFVNYKPYHFEDNTDTLHQVQAILSSGITCGSTPYHLMWYSDIDCKETTVTMIAPQLLPLGFTISGLRIKYKIKNMLNQESRMKYIAALQTSATEMSHCIKLECITSIQDANGMFNGCGIINKQWLKHIVKRNNLFRHKMVDKFKDFPSKTYPDLKELSCQELKEYLKYKGKQRECELCDDKQLLEAYVWSVLTYEKDRLTGQNDKDVQNDDDDNDVVIPPIEVLIGNIPIILVPYPKKTIDTMLETYGTKDTNRNAFIFLPQNMYKELCLVEYQRNRKGSVLYIDDDSDDEEVKNAEPCPESDEEPEQPTEDPLIAMMRNRGIPKHLLDENICALQNIKKYGNKNNDDNDNNDDDSEFLNDDIHLHPPQIINKLVKPEYAVPFYIYQDTKRCELLTTSKALINIWEYHRKKEDQESDEKTEKTLVVLRNLLAHIVKRNQHIMDHTNLKQTKEALRFLEIHNEMELYDTIRNKYYNQEYLHRDLHHNNKIPENSVEFKKLIQIRDKIWTKCCKSLEVPFITEPYLSRKMMAICDHTGNLPKGKVFIQLRTQQTSKKICMGCSQDIDECSMCCADCKTIVDDYTALHEKVIIMQSDALSPLSLREYDAVLSPSLAQLFPNQNILIFSSKDRNIVSELSATSNEEDTSYLNQYGRAKLFDCIITPVFDYDLMQKCPYRAEMYSNDFITGFSPSDPSRIMSSGFHVPLELKPPINENEENEMKYEDEQDDDNNDTFWSEKTLWIMDNMEQISNMDDYIQYFIQYNKYNFAADLRETFEVESQIKTQGMDAIRCRDFMKLYEHFMKLSQHNYAPNIFCDKLYGTKKLPHYMVSKPISLRKHVATMTGCLFDDILSHLPKHLHYLVDASLIIDPQRDYEKSVMDPQLEEWDKEEREKRAYGLICKHCDKQFRYWRLRKEHVETEEHQQRLQELRANRGDEHIQKYMESNGLVNDITIPNQPQNNQPQPQQPQYNNNNNNNNQHNNVQPRYNNNNNNNNNNVQQYNNHNQYNGNPYNPSNNNNNNNNNAQQPNNSPISVSKYSAVQFNNSNEQQPHANGLMTQGSDDFGWVLDAQKPIDDLTVDLHGKVNDKNFLQQQPHLLYQKFVAWSERLQNLVRKYNKLIEGHESKLGKDWIDGINRWQSYLESQRKHYKQKTIEAKQRNDPL